MYLQQLSIKGFRLFENLNLVLNPGLNVLAGENDSGKTTIIDAIRFTLGSNYSQRINISETDFHEGFDSFSIQLKFSDMDANGYRFVEHLSYEEYEDSDGKIKRKPVLYVQLNGKKTGKERRGYPYIQTEVRSGCDGNGLILDSEIRGFLATTYLKPLRDAESELSAGRASRLSQILNSYKKIRESTDSILETVSEANKKLLQEGDSLKNTAQTIQKNYLHNLVFESDRDDLGAFLDFIGLKVDDLNTLSDTDKRRHLRSVLEGLSLSLSEDGKLHGLGYHNLLFMAVELLLLEQEVEDEFPLLLIEEPEAHLHPQLQMKLLQFINRKVKSDRNANGIQCLLTTHSPNLSSKADPSTVILLRDGNAWALRPGETELDDHSDYIYLRKFLDATKANVFFAKGLLFVEGDAENILIPKIAELLGQPLEDYGVSVVKYDNSGSWKRFAKLFLRKNIKESTPITTRVCVIRDLDLWPDCAEEKEDESNPYGFKKVTKGNWRYWRKNCKNVQERIDELVDGLARQNVVVNISNDWTFEFCLAKYGLFDECYEAVNGSRKGITDINDDENLRSTYIQGNAKKTDFAYELGRILEEQREVAVKIAIESLDVDQRNNLKVRETTIRDAISKFASDLRSRLPPYIVESIDHVTASKVTEFQNLEDSENE